MLERDHRPLAIALTRTYHFHSNRQEVRGYATFLNVPPHTTHTYGEDFADLTKRMNQNLFRNAHGLSMSVLLHGAVDLPYYVISPTQSLAYRLSGGLLN